MPGTAAGHMPPADMNAPPWAQPWRCLVGWSLPVTLDAGTICRLRLGCTQVQTHTHVAGDNGCLTGCQSLGRQQEGMWGSTLPLVVDVLPLHCLPDHVVRKVVVSRCPANTRAGGSVELPARSISGTLHVPASCSHGCTPQTGTDPWQTKPQPRSRCSSQTAGCQPGASCPLTAAAPSPALIPRDSQMHRDKVLLVLVALALPPGDVGDVHHCSRPEAAAWGSCYGCRHPQAPAPGPSVPTPPPPLRDQHLGQIFPIPQPPFCPCPGRCSMGQSPQRPLCQSTTADTELQAGFWAK